LSWQVAASICQIQLLIVYSMYITLWFVFITIEPPDIVERMENNSFTVNLLDILMSDKTKSKYICT